MKRIIGIVLVVLFVVCMGSVASAAEKSAYVALKGGLFQPNSDDEGLKDYNNGYNVEVAFGYKFHPNFAVELDAGYLSTKFNKDTENDYNAWVIPVTVTAIAILPVKQFDLYAGAGLGWYFAHGENYRRVVDERDEYGNIVADHVEQYSGDGNGFGYHVMAGIAFNFTEHMAIGTEAKWSTAKPKFDDIDRNVGGIVYNLVLKYKF